MGVALNIPKYTVMTFCRNNVLIKYAYFINNTPLNISNDSLKDLEFTITPNLCSNMHIQIIYFKAFKLLGFINRVFVDFNMHTPFKALFCSLVRPILENGTILWDRLLPLLVTWLKESKEYSSIKLLIN